MRIKKRYLLPILYFVLLAITFVFPVLFPIIFILGAPVAFLVDSISRAVGGPTDTTVLILFGDVVQFYLIGYVWDKVAERMSDTDPETI